MFIVDLDELHLGKLLEILRERLGDVIQRAVGLALPDEIDVRHTIGIGEAAVTGETIEHQREALVPFDIAGTLEEFIEDRAEQILVGRDKARRFDLIRKLPGDQPVVIGEIDIDLHEQRRTRGLRRERRCERE